MGTSLCSICRRKLAVFSSIGCPVNRLSWQCPHFGASPRRVAVMRLIFSQCGHTRCSVALMPAVWGAAARFSRFTGARLATDGSEALVPRPQVELERPGATLLVVQVPVGVCDGIGIEHAILTTPFPQLRIA